jgi:hypothetical protein
VYAKTAAAFFPMGALFGCGMQEAGIPSERSGYGSAIHKANDQAMIVKPNVQYAFVCDFS